MSNKKEKTYGLSATYLILLFLTVLLGSCNSVSDHKEASVKTPDNLITLPPPSLISPAEQKKLHDTCEAWYNAMLKNGNFNGGMLVSIGGNIIFEQYKGGIPPGSENIITDSTVFHIASVSKTFTAMGVLKLGEEGKLNLEDELQKYFPAFDYPGVTIRTLLNHRSGLPNYLYFMEDLQWDESVPLKNQDILDALINRKAALEDISRPNTHFTYCNTNYALLALLIEKVSGIPYPQFIKENIFDPLHMKNSFVYTPADSARATPNYDYRGTPIKNNYLDNVYGDKNIYTTPRELLQWHRALNNNLFVNATSMMEAYTPYSNEHPGIKNYGLGWRMNIYPNGQKIIFHNGWWHGNNATFIRLLEKDVCIIVLGNRYTQSIYKAYQLINVFDSYTGQVDIEE